MRVLEICHRSLKKLAETVGESKSLEKLLAKTFPVLENDEAYRRGFHLSPNDSFLYNNLKHFN